MLRQDTIIAVARGWKGTPYHHQASLKGAGCDCLGLIRGVWRELHGAEPEAMPAYTKDWNEATGAEALLDAGRRHLMPIAVETAAAGDVLVFRLRATGPAKHAGILVDADRMVHAQEGMGVVEVSLSSWWRRRIAASFRFPIAREEHEGSSV